MLRTLPVGVLKGAVRDNGRRGVVSTRFVEVKRCNRSGRGAGVAECSNRRSAAADMPSTAHGSNHNSIDMVDKLWTGPNDDLHPSTLIFLLARVKQKLTQIAFWKAMSRGPQSTNLDRTFGRHLAHEPLEAAQPLAVVRERLWRHHRRPPAMSWFPACSSFICPARGARFASLLLAKEINRQIRD